MRLLSLFVLLFSFNGFALEVLDPSNNTSSSIDISGGDQTITFTISNTDGNPGSLYRSIRAPKDTSISNNTCTRGVVYDGATTCSFDLTISQAATDSTGSIVIKYIDGGVRKLAQHRMNYIKDAGVSLQPVFGVNGSGEIDFNTLSILQSAKRRVKIVNKGNTTSPKIGQVKTVITDKAITVISDTCSGQELDPEESCFIKLKVDSDKLFSGSATGSVEFLSEADGSSIY